MDSKPDTSQFTLKKFFHDQRMNLKKIAIEIGLIPATSDYTKFIILGRSRTGSNFLRGLLNSHPAVIVLGEIFRNRDAIDFDHPQFPTTDRVMKIYQSDPCMFLEKIVFRKIPENYKALGFKLFYYHANEIPFTKIWSTLKEKSDLHIIHIKRRNILRTHLSRENAVKTGQWVNTNGKENHLQTYQLDYDALLRDFVQTRQWEQKADLFFNDHPKLEVIYEELSKNTNEQIRNIQQFLGLPYHAVQPQTFKQIQRPLYEIIENYEDLKIKFKNTEWEEFFED
jgi:LPS sulfotransferase NodH